MTTAAASARGDVRFGYATALAVIGLVVVSDALTPLLSPSAGVEELSSDANPRRFATLLAIYAVAGVALLGFRLARLRALLLRPEILLIALLPLVSALWADDPLIAMRRAGAHALTVVFCIYLAAFMSPRAFVNTLLLALVIGAVFSFALVLAAPQIGVHRGNVNAGAWKGAYGHKNLLGRAMALTILLALALRPHTRGESVLRWAALALAIPLLVFSQSRTSWLLAALAPVLVVMLRVFALRRVSAGVKAIVFLIGATLAGAIVALLLPAAIEASGRDMTFSGRTSLWADAGGLAMERHPLLGAGYGSFWTDTSAHGLKEALAHWKRIPSNGHNGFFDTWLNLGVPGLIALVLLLGVALRRLGVRLLRPETAETAILFAAYVVFFLLLNLTESVAFRHSDLFWLLLIVGVLYTYQAPPAPAARPARRTRLLRTAQPIGPRTVRLARPGPDERET